MYMLTWQVRVLLYLQLQLSIHAQWIAMTV